MVECELEKTYTTFPILLFNEPLIITFRTFRTARFVAHCKLKNTHPANSRGVHLSLSDDLIRNVSIEIQFTIHYKNNTDTFVMTRYTAVQS